MILESFNYIFFFCYSLVSINKGFSLIFERLVNKIWFDNPNIFLLSVILFTVRLFLIPFLDFLRCLTQSFFPLIQVKRFHTLLSFLYLLRKQVRVIIEFLSSLLLKGDWLDITCFSLIGA